MAPVSQFGDKKKLVPWQQVLQFRDIVPCLRGSSCALWKTGGCGPTGQSAGTEQGRLYNSTAYPPAGSAYSPSSFKLDQLTSSWGPLLTKLSLPVGCKQAFRLKATTFIATAGI